jgi:hypothetical protein
MLSPRQITEVEAIYICRNYNTISDNLYAVFIEHFYDTNLEQFIYLRWLIQRWTLLRKNQHQMPTRIVQLYILLWSGVFHDSV